MTKKTKIIIGCVAGVLVIGALAGGGNSNTQTAEPTATTTAATTEAETNILLKTKLKTADVRSGSGDVIGTRAYVEIKKAELEALTMDEFTEFVNTVVKDSGYNYVSIIAEDASKAIVFPGSISEIAQYGKVDVDGMLTEVYGYINLQEDGTYKYEK